MAIYFKERFKKIRKAKDLTQEQLADVFMVSPQAVSRWETGAAYPDIELLPSIAAYFGISVDQLLGVDAIKDKERAKEIWAEIKENLNKGYLAEAVAQTRKAVREFPNDYEMQTTLAMLVMQKGEHEGDKELQKQHRLEALAISERILEHCTDEAIRSQVLSRLPRMYKKIGDMEKAIATAKKLPDYNSSSDIAFTMIYEGEELFTQLKKNVHSFSSALMYSLKQLAYYEYENKFASPERIQLLEQAAKVYDIVFTDGDYGLAHGNMQEIYFHLACDYCCAKDTENALDCLEKAAFHAIAFDNHGDLKIHTSLAVRGTPNNGISITPYTHTHAQRLLDDISEGFATIKETQRFKNVIAQLQENAKL